LLEEDNLNDVLWIFLGNGLLTSFIAHWKCRNRLGWFAIGGATLGFAVLVLLFLPKNQDELERRKIKRGTAKRCNACQEAIKVEASICKHCGTSQ